MNTATTSDTRPWNYRTAKSNALWVKRMVPGATAIQIVENLTGESYVKFINRAGQGRTLRNNDEFVAYRDIELAGGR